MGRLPKDPRTRARRNKPEELKQLPTVAEAAEFEVPPMPKPPGKKRKWAEPVVEWWRAIWTSPMSTMWVDADVKALIYDIARLRQFSAEATTPSEYLRLMAAIQRFESQLGLSPLDRLRLRWEIPDGHREEESTPSPESRAVESSRADEDDPRAALRAKGELGQESTNGQAGFRRVQAMITPESSEI